MYTKVDSTAVSSGNAAAGVVSGYRSNLAGIKARDTGVRTTIRPCTYAEYNFFVQQYNSDTNRIDKLYLKKVPSWFFMDVRNKYRLGLAVILCFIPFVCFLMLLLSVIRLISLIMVIFTVKKNRALVSNPFFNMIYLEGINLVNEYITFTAIHEITAFAGAAVITNNVAVMETSYARALHEGKPVEIMFFKSTFWNYEKQVLSRISWRIILTIIMIGISAIMSYISIFDIMLK